MTPKFIDFEEGQRSPSGKTRTWWVRSKNGGRIGMVHWYGPWRCYAFSPANDTIYEKVCLRDIADFCESRTTQHRAILSVEPSNG